MEEVLQAAWEAFQKALAAAHAAGLSVSIELPPPRGDLPTPSIQGVHIAGAQLHIEHSFG